MGPALRTIRCGGGEGTGYMVPIHGEQECAAWRGHRGVSPPAAAGERRPLQMTGTAELGGRPVSGQVAWAVGCV